jgi:HEPN domain-containing protein
MQDNIYKEWFKKAEEDELSIAAILKEGGANSTACFLSQQMAEKLLKGFLAYHKISFRKSHDLLELETLLLEKEPEIKNLHEDLKILNRYYIETRYPGDYPEFSFHDAEEAFVAAKSVKKFVLNKII